MGSWFATLLQENGKRVTIYDRDKRTARTLAHKKGFRIAQNLETTIRSVHVVVLATPTQTTATILERIMHWISPGTLIVDISSIKKPLRRILKRLDSRNIPVLSIHPMFGSGTKTLKGRTVFATAIPKRNVQANRLLSMFEAKGARVVRCSIKEHDALMSALLTLPHFLNIAMVNTLRAKGLAPGRLRELSGTTFSLQLLIAEAIHQENAENETSILMDSANSISIIQEFARQCRATLELIERGHRARIMSSFAASRHYLERDSMFGSAYEDFSAAAARAG